MLGKYKSNFIIGKIHGKDAMLPPVMSTDMLEPNIPLRYTENFQVKECQCLNVF